jgi:hypothetical protein
VTQPMGEGERVTTDLFDDAPARVAVTGPRFGPVFEAEHHGYCAACGEEIRVADAIRADGQGGWIHADADCERWAA